MNYLARLKLLDAGEKSLHVTNDEPTKPTKVGSDGYVGSIPGAFKNISTEIDAEETGNEDDLIFQKVTTPLPTKPSKGCDKALWAWLVTYEDHAVETYHHPEVTHAEAMRKYPDALAAEPIPERTKRTPTAAEETELRALVQAIGKAGKWATDEIEWATAGAMADPDGALACYRAILAVAD